MPYGKDAIRKLCQKIGTAIENARTTCDGKHRVREIVRKYLRATPEGKSLLEEMQGLTKKQAVMVVLSPDGWMDFYGHPNRVALSLLTKHPYDSTPEARRLSDEILEEQMNKGLRAMFWPNAVDGKPGCIGSTMVEEVVLPSGKKVFRFLECKNKWQNTMDGAIYVET